MDIGSAIIGDVVILELALQAGQSDASGSREFRETLVDRLGELRKLLIDLAGVEYLNSRLLGILVSGVNAAIERGAEVRLIGMRPAIREVFRVTRLDRIYEIRDSREDALASYSTDSGAVV